MARNKTIKPQNILAANEARGELTALKIQEFIDAIETLGIIRRACHAVGVSHSVVAQWMVKDKALAERIRHAQEVGRIHRKDYLESLAYDMAPTNPTMVMFLLKREDPSYRESYNVSTSSQPTNYVIDLGLPDDPTPIADVTPTHILE